MPSVRFRRPHLHLSCGIARSSRQQALGEAVQLGLCCHPVRQISFKQRVEALAVIVFLQRTDFVRQNIVDAMARCPYEGWIDVD